VLEKISTEKGFNFIYGNNLLDKIKITCVLDSDNLTNILHKIFSQNNIGYKLYDKNSYVLFEEKKSVEKTFRSVVIEQNMPSEDIKNKIIEPKIISRTEPVYPAEAVKSNIEGKVTIKLFVNERGDISNMYIGHSSGYAILDSATAYYAGKLKFSPALENGKPKNIWVSMTFDYRLINK
jgi:TonB family protein